MNEIRQDGAMLIYPLLVTLFSSVPVVLAVVAVLPSSRRELGRFAHRYGLALN
jgi:hypothetical protein